MVSAELRAGGEPERDGFELPHDLGRAVRPRVRLLFEQALGQGAEPG